MSHDASNVRASWQPITLILLVAAAAITVFIRDLPSGFRLPNLVPAGAMFLFAGARLRNPWFLLIPFSAMVFLDWSLFVAKQWQIPIASYLAYGVYLGLGFWLLRRSESLIRIPLVAFAGSISFFLITNTAFFLEMVINPNLHIGNYYYCEPTLAGLMKCYAQALEFARGTFLGDLIFAPIFFGAHVWLTRKFFVQEPIDNRTVEIK